MKRIVIVLTALALLATGCQKGQKFTVQGTVKETGFKDATSVKIEYELMENTLEAPVAGEAFLIKGRVPKPMFAKLSAIGGEKRMVRYFILEKGDITFKRGMACGTPLNDSTLAFTHRVSDIAQQYKGQRELQVQHIKEEFTAFVSRHKDDPCAIYAVMFGHNKLNKDFLLDLIESTSKEIQHDGEMRALYKELILPF